MKLFTRKQFNQLLDNGTFKNCGKDHKPVVKLFLPWSEANWLVTEIISDNHDIAFGLCDLGMGSPELGYFSISEIQSVRKFGLSVERDLSFEAKYPLSIYTKAAKLALHITENPVFLAAAAES